MMMLVFTTQFVFPFSLVKEFKKFKNTSWTIKGFLILVIGMFFSFAEVKAQTIGTVSVTGAPVCAGSNVSISFLVQNGNTSGKEFTLATTYNVFLSNSSGSTFASLGNFSSSSTPPVAGNNNTATITIINVPISNLTPAGNGYKIARAPIVHIRK